MQPKISIVTITFNSEKTLERTIQSVISQDYENVEYIIVDGASNDKTLDIIKSYADKGITSWISEPDKGISDAFNKGISLATGEIIGIINSDDGLEAGALRAVAEAYEPDVDVYRGNIYFWNTDSGAKIREVPSMSFPFSKQVNISHQGTFVAKAAYEKYGVFNVDYKYSMDYDILLRFEKAGAKFKYVDATLAYFTIGGLTFTSYSSERRKETETIMRSHGAKPWHIWRFRILKYTKNFIKKHVNIDLLLRLRHRKD
ncbi:MAG: glycosyltransferase [Oscillospiraceae bacterium]|nr:glycosyltransferase [Oscillospiraceae bacterium]